MSLAYRVDVALRAVLASAAAASVTLCIDWHKSPLDRTWPFVFGFATPVIALLAIGRAATIGQLLVVGALILQTVVIAAAFGCAMYSMLARLSEDGYKIAMPFVNSLFTFLFMLSPWTPVKAIAILTMVCSTAFPLRIPPLVSPPWDELPLQFVGAVAIGVFCALGALLVPLPTAARCRPRPASAALEAFDKVRHGRLLMASLLRDLGEAATCEPDEEGGRLLSTTARMSNTSRHLRATVSRVEALLGPAQLELAAICSDAAAAELTSWSGMFKTEQPLVLAMVRICTRQLARDDLEDEQERVSRETLRRSVCALTNQLSRVLESGTAGSAAAGAAAAQISECRAKCLEADRQARAARARLESPDRGPPPPAEDETALKTSLQAPGEQYLRVARRDAWLNYFLTLAGDVERFVTRPLSPAPPAVARLQTFVPILKTWRTPLGSSHTFNMMLPAIKMAIAMAIACLWVSVDAMYNVTSTHAAWVPITVALVPLAHNVADSFGSSFDRLTAQVLACCYVLFVITVLTGEHARSSHPILVGLACPWVFLCFLVRPTVRDGWGLVGAAFTYYVLMFTGPRVGDADVVQSNFVDFVVNRVGWSTVGVLTVLFVELGFFPASPVHVVEDVARRLPTLVAAAVEQAVASLQRFNEPPGSTSVVESIDSAVRTCVAQRQAAVAATGPASYEPYALVVRQPPFDAQLYLQLLDDYGAAVQALVLLSRTLSAWHACHPAQDKVLREVLAWLAEQPKHISPALKAAGAALSRHGAALRSREPFERAKGCCAARRPTASGGETDVGAAADAAALLCAVRRLSTLPAKISSVWAGLVHRAWRSRAAASSGESNGQLDDAQLAILTLEGVGAALFALVDALAAAGATTELIVGRELELELAPATCRQGSPPADVELSGKDAV